MSPSWHRLAWEHVGDLRSCGTVLPRTREALTALSALTGWVPTVLAGNIAANACLKLAAIDLHRLLDLDAGTYGADAEQRPDLIAVARERIRHDRGMRGDDRTFWSVTPHETWKRLYDWFRDHHGLHWRSHPIGRCGCFRAGGHNRSDSHALSSNC